MNAGRLQPHLLLRRERIWVAAGIRLVELGRLFPPGGIVDVVAVEVPAYRGVDEDGAVPLRDRHDGSLRFGPRHCDDDGGSSVAL